MTLVFRESERMLARALKVIPLGTQTFSKSHTQYPHGVSPFYAARGDGCRLWDVDGNCFVDFASALCAVTLGYNDPDVTAAVQAQLADGVLFTLPHRIEVDAAEEITNMVPCAEMVRFGKNGSDATAGAIRVARGFQLGRDHVAVCGYHGWQDWFIGSTARNLGVPEATQALTHSFVYNDLNSLHALFKQYPNQIAAVILEPMNVFYPAAGFLEGVAEITRKNGAVLVFDEMITGFRFANGGAQELFGVTPDLATFGKGLANGFPVSAVAGRADIMKLFDQVFFSFTMGGETLSLAATCATLRKLRREPVVATLHERGSRLLKGVANGSSAMGSAGFLSTGGHPSWSFLIFKDAGDYSLWEIKTLWLQEVLARGFLTLTTHVMNYAHGDLEIDGLLAAYDEIFPILREAVEEKRLGQLLRCKSLEPLFRVR